MNKSQQTQNVFVLFYFIFVFFFPSHWVNYLKTFCHIIYWWLNFSSELLWSFFFFETHVFVHISTTISNQMSKSKGFSPCERETIFSIKTTKKDLNWLRIGKQKTRYNIQCSSLSLVVCVCVFFNKYFSVSDLKTKLILKYFPAQFGRIRDRNKKKNAPNVKWNEIEFVNNFNKILNECIQQTIEIVCIVARKKKGEGGWRMKEKIERNYNCDWNKKNSSMDEYLVFQHIIVNLILLFGSFHFMFLFFFFIFWCCCYWWCANSALQLSAFDNVLDNSMVLNNMWRASC